MQLLGFLPIVAQIALVQCQLSQDSTIDTALQLSKNDTIDSVLRNVSITYNGSLKDSPVLHQLPPGSNGTTSLQAQGINFTHGVYDYTGRVADEGELRESLSKLIDLLFLKPLLNTAEEFWTPSLGSRYLNNAKATLTISDGTPIWSTTQLADMVTALRDYLRQHDSYHNLEVDVSAPSGLRATIKVVEVDGVAAQGFYIQPIYGIGNWTLIWYNDDEVEYNSAMTTMLELLKWTRRSDSDQLIEPGSVKSADSGRADLAVTVAEGQAGPIHVTYNLAFVLLLLIVQFADNYTRDKGDWRALQLMFWDHEGKYQGQIDLRSLPEYPRSRFRPATNGTNRIHDSTITDVTDLISS